MATIDNIVETPYFVDTNVDSRSNRATRQESLEKPVKSFEPLVMVRVVPRVVRREVVSAAHRGDDGKSSFVSVLADSSGSHANGPDRRGRTR